MANTPEAPKGSLKPKIEIANNHGGTTGYELAGNSGFVMGTLDRFLRIFGKSATLRDIAGLAEPGTTASSDKK